MFASLRIRNYRLYFIGQGLSFAGNWMQVVGMSWLVLQLTGNGVALGSVLAVRFAPMLFGGPFAGMIVDRFEKRKILYVTQSLFVILALALSISVYTETIQVWMLFMFAAIYGSVDVIDHPTRQTFVHEMVGRENLRNAVTLNSTEANLARALGPLIAGSLIATVGIAFCFLANAISFCAVLFVISLMDSKDFRRESTESKPMGDIWAGLVYVLSVPVIRAVLVVMAVIGTFSYEFQVTLPLLAQNTFGGTAADYAALVSAMGAGSVAGGLFAVSRQRIAAREFIGAAFFFGVSICLTGIMPTLGLAVIGMFFVGFFSINLLSLGNTTIQLSAAPHMRGRVMSFWAMAIFGSTLVGAPIIGFVGQYAGARWGLALSGTAAILASWYAYRAMPQQDDLIDQSQIVDEEKATPDTIKL